MCTTAFGGAGVTVWGCFSLNCKFDLYVLDVTLTGQKYRHLDLCSLFVPHFDCDRLTSRPILMDANVRPHSAKLSATGGNRATTLASHVTGYESSRAFMELFRTKMSILQELETVLVQEWQQYPQHRLRRLIKGMRRRVQELYRIRGS